MNFLFAVTSISFVITAKPTKSVWTASSAPLTLTALATVQNSRCTLIFTKIVPYEAYKKLDMGLNVVHT